MRSRKSPSKECASLLNYIHTFCESTLVRAVRHRENNDSRIHYSFVRINADNRCDRCDRFDRNKRIYRQLSTTSILYREISKYLRRLMESNRQKKFAFRRSSATRSSEQADKRETGVTHNNGKVLPILMPELDGSSFLVPQLPARLSANSGRSFSNSATEARPSHPQPKWGKCNACTWTQPRSASQTRDTCSPDRFMSRTRRDRLPAAWPRPRQRAFTTHSSLKSIV